jgi:hypothetical protein
MILQSHSKRKIALLLFLAIGPAQGLHGSGIAPLSFSATAAAGGALLGKIHGYCDHTDMLALEPYLGEFLFCVCGYGAITYFCLAMQRNTQALYPVTIAASMLGYIWGRFGNPFQQKEK